jgi:hypothetical protein
MKRFLVIIVVALSLKLPAQDYKNFLCDDVNPAGIQ